MLADVYKTEGPFERFRNLATNFVVQYPNDDFAGAMIYLLADAYTSINEYEALAVDFGNMIATMTSGSVMDGLYYWRGMAGIFLEDYDMSRRASPAFRSVFDQPILKMRSFNSGSVRVWRFGSGQRHHERILQISEERFAG